MADDAAKPAKPKGKKEEADPEWSTGRKDPARPSQPGAASPAAKPEAPAAPAKERSSPFKAREPKVAAPAASKDPTPAPSHVKPAQDQATADPTGPRATGPRGQGAPAPIEPANVGKPMPRPAAQTAPLGESPPATSRPTGAPTAATAAPAAPTASPPAAKPATAPAAGAQAAPAAKAAPAPPPPEPTGDHAMLRDAHGPDVSRYEVLDDGVGVLTVTPEGLLTVASEAKAMGYQVLSLLSAYDRGDHFGILYAFVKPAGTPEAFGEMRLRVTLPKKDAAGAALEPECPSLVPVFKGADWQEREMYDMYGIRFIGHPDLRRMFLPDGWTGWPMRKDYKEPEQFVAMRDGEDIVVRSPEEGAW